VGSLDLPDQPDEARQAEHASAGGADRSTPKSGEIPDPDERGRAYEAMRAHVSAETSAETSPGRRPDGGDQRGYWDEVPRFRDMWADHERRWPERSHAAVDRSGDPPGSYRSDGGFCLNPEQHAEASEAIRQMRKTEQAISADMQTIGKENAQGGWLEGFGHRIKGDDRLKEKIAEQVAVEPDKPCSLILRKIPDALRYTCCVEPDNYTEGYYDIKAWLENLGHEMYQGTNYWADPEYKGINTRWVTQHGQRFEVQFHTPESFHAKEYVTHKAYERLRNTQISAEERGELEDFQREVSSHIQVPDSAADIPDFKKEGF
jgi:hypothetical protein